MFCFYGPVGGTSIKCRSQPYQSQPHQITRPILGLIDTESARNIIVTVTTARRRDIFDFESRDSSTGGGGIRKVSPPNLPRQNSKDHNSDW